MKNKKRWFYAFISLTIALLAFATTLWTIKLSSVRSIQQAEIALREQIDRDLPKGSNKGQVNDFLKAHKLYTDGYRTLSVDYQPLYEGASSILYATTPNNKTTIGECQILILFEFNGGEKLQGYSSSPKCKTLWF
jgi:hypothetical protein